VDDTTTAIAAALDQVGPRLKQLRSRRGVTLTALSEATGIFRRPGPNSEPAPKSHEGYEWLFVLSGRMRLVLGDHDLVLGVGEASEFDTHVPHWFGSTGDQQAEILRVFGPQGERATARARSVSTKASAE
jgi:mannose-6-phosphate isomerase-like protein (cupin superfamily)